MKNLIKKILILLSIVIFIYSCKNNTSVNKYQGTYEGSTITKQNTKQLPNNKTTVKVNENSSINVIMEGGNVYDKNVEIAEEELTKVNDDTYIAQKMEIIIPLIFIKIIYH